MGNRRGRSAGFGTGWLLAAIAALGAPWVAAAQDARILYFEPLRSLTPDRDVVLRKHASPKLRELRFDAFGRSFQFSLDTNSALTDQLRSKATSSSLRLYRGRLDNIAGSWARLAVKDGSLQGMFWDGVDLYVIEPVAQVRDSLAPPLDAGAADVVIFRMADVLIDASEASCAVDASTDALKGSQEYAALLHELKNAPAIMQAAGANVRLQLSAMGDSLFKQRYASEQDARDAILMRLNNVDGIFSSQLGVEIQVPAVVVNATNSDPLTDVTSANALLQELGKLRRRSPELKSSGLTHLFTGRDLDGTTVGIAYLNRLCHAEFGAGLTEVSTFSAWRDSLVAAHEIGHNFGASHDGASGSSCAATPEGTWLMSPSVSGSDQFSQCSLNTMLVKVQAASCITRLPDADIAIAGNLGSVHKPVSQSFDWTLDIANIGGVTAERVRADILVPPVVLVDDAYVIGGSCTSGAGVIFCQLGDVPGGGARTINLTLRSDVVGSSSISVRVASNNDASLANNRGDGELLIEPEADLGLSLQGPASVAVAETFELSFAVTNHAAIEATDLDIEVKLPAGVVASNASLPNAVCVVGAVNVQCALSSLHARASASGLITLSASSPGAVALRGRVAGAYVDPQSGNDDAEHIVAVAPSPAAAAQDAASDGGRGGGGAASLSLLLGLAGLRSLRCRAFTTAGRRDSPP